MGGLILPVPYSNPYAQPWRLPNFETPYVPLRWTYGGTFTVAAGTTVFNQAIPINGNADFWARELAFYVATIPGGTAPNAGSITVRFKDSLGKRWMPDMLTIEELEGPMPISQRCLRTTQILVDIANTDAVDYNVQVILKGIEEFEPLGINRCMPGFDPERYIPLYDMYSIPPEGWHDEPFDYWFDIDATAGQRLQTLLPMEGDADFYWRGITGYANGAAGRQTLRFIDAWQNQLSQNFVVQANVLGTAPYARPIYPEVCCPAYSVLAVDQVEYLGAAASSISMAFRGVKRFRD